MKLMSLFDGSGGFPLAASLCGIEPVYASEVEPYPIAVTKSRFPNMKHLGDVSRIKGAEIEPVDIITFGSPCQDMSVAGKRAGLKHTAVGDEETTRSGLFMEAIRIIKEMRVKTNGIYPRFAVWENVPGAFSSNRGEDFRLVLEEFIKITEPDAVMPAVPQAGWAYADCISGDGWSIAYRVFDAQHWGVPQRRRRIYLVADFRGECARKILFEREGVRGYFTQSRTPWQGIASDAQKCVGTDDRVGEIPYTLKIRSGCEGGGKGADARGNGDGQTVSTITGDHNNRITDYTCLVVEPAVRCYDIGEARLRTPSEYIEKTPTLTARCGTGGNNVPGVVYCLQGNGIDRADTAGCNGKGWRENECYTLNTIDRPAVVYCVGNGQLDQAKLSEKVGALNCMHDQQCVMQVKAAGIDCRNFNEYVELYPTLQAKPNGGQSLNFSHAVRIHYLVRRLTPTECARLQGFPDLWGHPDYKENLTDEEFQFWLAVRNTHAAINGKQTKEYTKPQILTWYNKLHTDSSEYKMWGNGIALPNALYVMQGIAAEAEIPIKYKELEI